LVSFSQEQWSTLAISGKLNQKYSIFSEGEQRFSYDMQRVRYFHYDFGVIRVLATKWKMGLFYREIYEIKNNIRVTEYRPHIDLFYSDNIHLKIRTRFEYQFKETSQNWRFRIRPCYEFKVFKNFDPYIQTELNFTKDGFTRNRFNAGITINYGKFQIQPGYILESLHNISNNTWNHTNVMWINTKINF
jgi:hypothetical protein